MQTNILSTLAVCLGLVSATLTCKSESQPNPIAASSGLNITGTINGTLAVLPIPLSQAQSIVGSKYTIQTAVYRSLIPSLPEDMYPALLQAVLDHDVQAGGIGIPDFTRISIEYPFLSMPGAKSTSLFRLANTQLMTATNPVALAGSASYGTRVIPASFDPPCDAYAYSTPGQANVTTTHLNANHPLPADGGALFTTTFSTLGACGGDGGVGCEIHDSPYPLSFFANVTNQPSFADPAKGCDVQRRYFDTAVTMAPWEPVAVRGEVWASKDVFGGEDAGTTWKGVWGVKVDTAFLEINYQKSYTYPFSLTTATTATLRFGILSVLTALCLSAVCTAVACTPESQPNPLAGTKFKLDPLTGTANGTLAIILLPLDEALKIIGSKYTIQTGAYRELVPAMPKDAYPAFFQAAIEHDVQQADGVKLPDFTRVSIEFPFLTIPDGNPSKLFRLIKSQLVSASNADAISQSTSYGANVISATFDPPCDPYAYTRDGNATFLQGFKKGDTGNGDIQFDSKWETVDSPDGQMPWPVSFFVNITNQPSFTVPDHGCLVQLTSVDNNISQGQWSPVVVKGFADVAGDLYNGGDAKKWDDVWGIQVDHTFIRLHHINCTKI